MSAEARATALRRWRQSTKSGPVWSCSTYGSTEARWTGWKYSTQSKRANPICRLSFSRGTETSDTAVSAVSRGAVDFIEKPFETERLLHLVERATETERLRRENTRLREGFGEAGEFTGNSATINAVRATLKRVAGTGSRVMISGPAGAGKRSQRGFFTAGHPGPTTIRGRELGPDHAGKVRGRAVRGRE